MRINSIREAVDQVVSRIPATKGKGEEATKQALIMPILASLGYDTCNPLEVCPEYDADFAIRKGALKEKVDLAILQNDTPVIFIEAKASDVQLDDHLGQLSRYFNAVQSVAIAILTNGVEWRLFTDTVAPNMMDTTPFLTFRVEYANDHELNEFSRIAKNEPFTGTIREHAGKLLYTAKIASFLKNEIDIGNREPSEYFVKWVLKGQGADEKAIYPGAVWKDVVEEFRPIVKSALLQVNRDIARRSLSAFDERIAQEPDSNSVDVDDTSLDLTDEERVLFEEVKMICASSKMANQQVYDPGAKQLTSVEMGCKPTAAYLGIYFTKYWWWFMRVSFRTQYAKWIGFNLPPDEAKAFIPNDTELMPPTTAAPTRIQITETRDIEWLKPLVVEAFEREVRKYIGT